MRRREVLIREGSAVNGTPTCAVVVREVAALALFFGEGRKEVSYGVRAQTHYFQCEKPSVTLSGFFSDVIFVVICQVETCVVCPEPRSISISLSFLIRTMNCGITRWNLLPLYPLPSSNRHSCLKFSAVFGVASFFSSMVILPSFVASP